MMAQNMNKQQGGVQSVQDGDRMPFETEKSVDYPSNASKFFLSLFRDKGEEDVHTGETYETQTSSEINKLKSEKCQLDDGSRGPEEGKR
ncbi:hypothetical protein QYF36_018674 [Acer negundo]|nr:hypothetical protein QYF36_018674 [Acer negundo]